MQSLQRANEQFRKGDALTDADLGALIAIYSSLSMNLDRLNDPRFYLFEDEIRRRLYSLEGFQKARKEK